MMAVVLALAPALELRLELLLARRLARRLELLLARRLELHTTVGFHTVRASNHTSSQQNQHPITAPTANTIGTRRERHHTNNAIQISITRRPLTIQFKSRNHQHTSNGSSTLRQRAGATQQQIEKKAHNSMIPRISWCNRKARHNNSA